LLDTFPGMIPQTVLDHVLRPRFHCACPLLPARRSPLGKCALLACAVS
jgi:hypothetical protein